MSRTALVRLAPQVDLKWINNSDAERRVLYSGTRLASGHTTRVVLDHDYDRRIGEVVELFQTRELLLGVDAPWLYARVRLDDDAPGWIKRGVGASISTVASSDKELNGWTTRRFGICREVTLCDASKPAEPLAQVLYVEEEQAKPPPRAQTRRERERDELRRAQANWREELERRYDAAIAAAAGGIVDYGAIIRGLQSELGVAQIRPIDLAYDQYKQGQLA